jgi:hypothetical protein
MTKAKNPRYTTPTGVAQYPRLTKPDTKFNPDGEYKVKLEIPGDSASDLTTFLDEQFEMAVAKAKKDNPGKKIKEGNAPYETDEDTGKVVVSFKLKAKVTPKNGDPFEQRPALFDAKGKPIKDVNVGGGSTMKIAYEVVPYYTAIAGAGVSLRLKAAQIINLVEFSGGASAEGFGFGEEEGYEAEDTPAAQNGFTDEETSNNSDF